MTRLPIVLLILFSFSSFAKSIPCDENSVDFLSGQVIKITDGDTINVGTPENYYKIRLLNIDAPETNFQGQSQGVWGEKAKENLVTLIPLGTQVTVKFDSQKCDIYKRWLGTIYESDTQLDVNAQQVKDGLAVLYCIYPNISKCKEYSVYQKEAMDEGISFVTDPTIELPYLFRHNGINKKPVADLNDYKVYPPEYMENIPVYLRLFFMSWKDVKPPYHK